MADQIRIKAEAAEDIPVLSALLQDATVRVGDMAYEPGRHRFAAVLNRFRWEKDERGKRGDERVRTGLHFDTVLKASLQHMPMQDPDHVLELLAIRTEPSDDGNWCIILTFSGHTAVRLMVECIDGSLADLRAPWSTKSRPEHPTADNDQ